MIHRRSERKSNKRDVKPPDRRLESKSRLVDSGEKPTPDTYIRNREADVDLTDRDSVKYICSDVQSNIEIIFEHEVVIIEHSLALLLHQLELPLLFSGSFVVHVSSPLAASSPLLIDHIPDDVSQAISSISH